MPRGREYSEVSYQTREWAILRAKQLKKEPWCRYCRQNHMRTKATHADHIKPHRGNPALFRDPDNLQSLCTVCANTVKQVEEIIGEEIGCDLLGNPRGANHPWNGGSVDRPQHTSRSIGRMLQDRKKRLE